MSNPDEEMDSLVLYTPDVEPMTEEDIKELSQMFAFLRQDEKEAA